MSTISNRKQNISDRTLTEEDKENLGRAFLALRVMVNEIDSSINFKDENVPKEYLCIANEKFGKALVAYSERLKFKSTFWSERYFSNFSYQIKLIGLLLCDIDLFEKQMQQTKKIEFLPLIQIVRKCFDFEFLENAENERALLESLRYLKNYRIVDKLMLNNNHNLYIALLKIMEISADYHECVSVYINDCIKSLNCLSLSTELTTISEASSLNQEVPHTPTPNDPSDTTKVPLNQSVLIDTTENDVTQRLSENFNQLTITREKEKVNLDKLKTINDLQNLFGFSENESKTFNDWFHSLKVYESNSEEKIKTIKSDKVAKDLTNLSTEESDSKSQNFNGIFYDFIEGHNEKITCKICKHKDVTEIAELDTKKAVMELRPSSSTQTHYKDRIFKMSSIVIISVCDRYVETTIRKLNNENDPK